jgi:predicted Holliday junction resolvase-like endonuclease
MPQDLINELKTDPNIFAECPGGGKSFPLCRAVMFYVSGPVPPEAKKILAQMEAAIKQGRKDLIQKRRKIKQRAETATIASTLGKVIEKVVPAATGFEFNRRDCRGLFEPIDYLVFNGLTANEGNVESLIFLDVKTGQARLNKHQIQIKDAVEKGKVEWDEYGGNL